MMINKNIQMSVILFLTMLTAVGCSEKDQESKTTITTTDPQKEHQAQQHSQQFEKAASNPTVNTKEVDLENLIKETEKRQEQANERGYEWSTTGALIEQAQTAVKEGKRELAIKLFQEAKMQSELAIEQANYADEHWQLLMPK